MSRHPGRVSLLDVLIAACSRPAETALALGRPAPAFTATDAAGKKRSLAEFRGRPVALLFFCGCSNRSELAREWGDLQRAGVLDAPTRGGKTPVTVAVMESSAKVMRAYLAENGLSLDRSVLMPDPAGKLTTLYSADPGPRVFVLDGRGVLRYTNRKDDAGEKPGEAQAIAAQALTALRAAAEDAGRKK